MSITCCREKAVIVTVYEEKPRAMSRTSENGLSSRGRHHHHHHYHHIYHDVSKHEKIGRGYNRRAELLDYARHLRATSETSNSKAPLTTQILPAETKPKRATSPSCLGKWDSLIPSFFRTTMKTKEKKRSSVFTATKMKALLKCFQVQKKEIFMSKLVTRLPKHHK